MKPLAFNAKVRDNIDGTKTAEIHGKWIHALDSNGTWQDIDTEFTDQGAYFGIGNAPFRVKIPKMSDGIAEFINENRWDVFSAERVRDNPVSMEIKAIGTSLVAGYIERGDLGYGETTYVIYPNAYPFGDLIYYVHFGRAPRLCKLVRFNQAPANDLSVDFDIRYSKNPTISRLDASPARLAQYEALLQWLSGRMGRDRIKGEMFARNALRSKWLQSSSLVTKRSISHSFGGMRGIGFKDFYIWDSAEQEKKKKELINVTYSKNNSWFRLTKNIPVSFFSNVVYPVFTDTTGTFYPDPNTETTSVDGMLGEIRSDGFAQAQWDAIHDDTSAGYIVNDSADNFTTGCGKTSAGFYLYRCAILFDTSSIDDVATINSFTVDLYSDYKTNGDNDGEDFIAIVHPANLSSNTAVINVDFNDIGAVDNPTEAVTRIDIGSLSTGAHNVFTGTDTTLVSKTGVTKFGIREGHDVLDHPYAGSTDTDNTVRFYSAEKTGTSTDPTLSVIYTLPVVSNFMLLGVG